MGSGSAFGDLGEQRRLDAARVISSVTDQFCVIGRGRRTALRLPFGKPFAYLSLYISAYHST